MSCAADRRASVASPAAQRRALYPAARNVGTAKGPVPIITIRMVRASPGDSSVTLFPFDPLLGDHIFFGNGTRLAAAAEIGLELVERIARGDFAGLVHAIEERTPSK